MCTFSCINVIELYEAQRGYDSRTTKGKSNVCECIAQYTLLCWRRISSHTSEILFDRPLYFLYPRANQSLS